MTRHQSGDVIDWAFYRLGDGRIVQVYKLKLLTGSEWRIDWMFSVPLRGERVQRRTWLGTKRSALRWVREHGGDTSKPFHDLNGPEAADDVQRFYHATHEADG